MKKTALLNIIIIILLLGCDSKESEKLDLESNLVTFDYSSLKGKNVEELIDLIVQDSLVFLYSGDQDVVSSLIITFDKKAMLFIYFDKDESIDIFSDVDLALVSQNEIKRITVYNALSASAELIDIDFEK